MGLPRWLTSDRPESADESPLDAGLPRRERRTDRIRPWLMVLVVAAVGLGLVLLQYWRRGVFLMGVAFALAAVLRLVLSTSLAGLLAVRFKTLDVVLYGALSALILIGAFVVPPPGGDG